MKSLRVRAVLASMLVLSATTLSAQAGKVSCKDGTKPKGGHFSCWGHGGIVTGALKSAVKSDAKTASKAATKHRAASKAKKTAGTKPTRSRRRPTGRRFTRSGARRTTRASLASLLIDRHRVELLLPGEASETGRAGRRPFTRLDALESDAIDTVRKAGTPLAKRG